MRVDLDELKKNIGRQLKEMEEKEAHLLEQLGHLVAVQNLAKADPPKKTGSNGLDISDVRRAILGGDR